MTTFPEPKITINGIKLTEGQAMTVRVALAGFQFQLGEKKFVEALGPIGPAYRTRLDEINHIMFWEKADE